ncbi:MAG: aspartate kinase [SAR116 cluster bacterium]|nr:aspartate kinase [SAR116 cluster bacterium]RPH12256.1 MAG: aspartate kinase [Alphaproteobacteria bacterium TMED54]
MKLIVAKFGGTSVETIDRIKSVASRIKNEVNNGYNVIVVVSAMAGETNRLIKLVESLTNDYRTSEYDTVISSGEQVTSGLLAIALNDINIKAKSYQAWQIPITTDDNFSKANIENISKDKVNFELDNEYVIVVPGFQGTYKNRITTLGRGGSDTSAVAIAAAFKAGRCDIYTDVDGVYTADPRVVSNALKLKTITFEEMLELASQGAKVLQTRSVALAMNYNIKLQVLSSFEDKPGTFIIGERQKNMEKTIISGITYTSNEAKITLFNVNDKPGQAAMIFGALADKGINVDMIVQTSTKDGEATDITFTVLQSDLLNAADIIVKLKPEIGYNKMIEDSKVSKVSVVGSGMRTKPGIAKIMFKTLADNNINIQVISTSEIKISVLISSDYTELAVRTLHDEFQLSN